MDNIKNTIFIAGNMPSSKNSKQITRSGFIVHSKQCQTYYKLSKQDYIDKKEEFIEMFKNESKPYYIGFYAIRKSKHKYDDINIFQTIADLMVKYDWIADDNNDEIKPIFLGYHHDKDNPGVFISNEGPTFRKTYEKVAMKFKKK